MSTSQEQVFFVSLPNVLKRKICDFATADEVLALVSACSLLRDELPVSVLREPYELLYSHSYNGSPLPAKDNKNDDNGSQQAYPIKVGMMIPTFFFATHCHSLRLTCRWIDQGVWDECGTIFLVSQPKEDENSLLCYKNTIPTKLILVNDQGLTGTILWQSPVNKTTTRQQQDELDVTFRYDPQCDYAIWYQCPGERHFILIENLEIHGILIWDDESRTRKKTYVKCMEWDRTLDSIENLEWDDDHESHGDVASLYTSLYRLPIFSFLLKLVSFSLDLLLMGSDEDLGVSPSTEQPLLSQPLGSFWGSLLASMSLPMSRAALIGLRSVADIFCLLIRSNISEEYDLRMKGVGGRDPHDDGEVIRPNVKILTLPPILLSPKCSYEFPSDRPYTISRIPVVRGTQSFRITGRWMMTDRNESGFSKSNVHPLTSSPKSNVHPLTSSHQEHHEVEKKKMMMMIMPLSVFVNLTPAAAHRRGECESIFLPDSELPFGQGYHQSLSQQQESRTIISPPPPPHNHPQSLVFDQTFLVQPDPDALGYYLCCGCVGPTTTTAKTNNNNDYLVVLESVSVHLSLAIPADHEEEDVEQLSQEGIWNQCINLLLLGQTTTTPAAYDRLFHLGLLQSVASELVSRLEEESHDFCGSDAVSSILVLLDEEGFLSSKVGLECLAEMMNSIIHRQGVAFSASPIDSERTNLPLGSYAAM